MKSKNFIRKCAKILQQFDFIKVNNLCVDINHISVDNL